jgi:hypothetical protein
MAEAPNREIFIRYRGQAEEGSPSWRRWLPQLYW